MLLCCVSITCLALSSIRQKHSRARSHASGRGRQTEPGNTAASCWATSSFTSRCLPAAPERSQEACIACPGGSLAARARARPQACFPATGQIARMRRRRGREGEGGRATPRKRTPRARVLPTRSLVLFPCFSCAGAPSPAAAAASPSARRHEHNANACSCSHVTRYTALHS
jgi:hypothetical protein